MAPVNTNPIIRKIKDVVSEEVPRSPGAAIQILLGGRDEMPNFHVRMFTLEPGATIPKHVHDGIEHLQVMLEGTMELTIDDEPSTVVAEDVMYIPAKATHAYANRTEQPVRFLCMIPANLAYTTDFL